MNRRHGFTLLELLVVVAVLALLLLLPVAARRAPQHAGDTELQQRDSLLRLAATRGQPVSGMIYHDGASLMLTAWPDGRLAVRSSERP